MGRRGLKGEKVKRLRGRRMPDDEIIGDGGYFMTNGRITILC